MPLTQQHLNGDQICVMDVETTGLQVGYHEIIQIAILPIDSEYKIRSDVAPFYIKIKPNYPERANPEALKKNKLRLAELVLKGVDREKSRDLLEDWTDKLKLPFNKYGSRRCRIVPLGHNLNFDIDFMKQWLGPENYNYLFAPTFRDTMIIGSYLNDRASMLAETVPFPKLTLAFMAGHLDIPTQRAHDALQDCLMTSRLYRKMLSSHGHLW